MAEIKLKRVMHALSDPERLRIVRTLARGDEITCGALLADRPKSSMSHHFKILREAGLLRTRVEGKDHHNALRLEELNTRFPGLLDSVVRAIDLENAPSRRQKKRRTDARRS